MIFSSKSDLTYRLCLVTKEQMNPLLQSIFLQIAVLVRTNRVMDWGTKLD